MTLSNLGLIVIVIVAWSIIALLVGLVLGAILDRGDDDDDDEFKPLIWR